MLIHEEVDRPRSRSNESIASKIPECPEGLRCEGAWIKPEFRRSQLHACRDAGGTEAASLRSSARGIRAESGDQIRPVGEVGAAGLISRSIPGIFDGEGNSGS